MRKSLHAIGLGAFPSTKLQDVAETLRHDHAAACAASLDQGIGDDGGAVHEDIDILRRKVDAFHGVEQALGETVARGGRLADLYPAAFFIQEK